MAGDTYDVVVVGYGLAGATAALTAADLGASVLLVEKETEGDHLPSSKLANIVMYVKDVERATTYFDLCAGGMVPRAVSAAWAARAYQLPDWLDAHGLRFEPVRGAQQKELEGYESLQVSMVVRQENDVRIEQRVDPFGVTFASGQQNNSLVHNEFFQVMMGLVAAHDNITVAWGSPAQRLIQREDGRIVGVETATGSVHARKGVILTCGGYEFDDELKLNYLKAHPIHFYGSQSNTGDGVRMALAVGADLWHMNQMVGRGIGHFPMDDGRSVNGIANLHPQGYVITDKHGDRFANEYDQAKIIEHTFYYRLMGYDPTLREYPRIPCYWFFDSKRMAEGPILIATGASRYEWSADNRAEVDRGWIKEGATIAEVAALVGVTDPGAAQDAVDEYNAYCASGGDPFGRPDDTMVPLDSGPFYAVPLYPGGPNTSGGPRRDEFAHIVDPFGAPIPGLYSAGELGEPIGMLYPSSGSNLSDALCFGQIAAESAVAAEPA